jgi:hypothetical protein
MTFVAAAVISAGASLIGGSMQAGAARDAAGMQAAAADRAAQQQREMFDIQYEGGRPYREAGYRGLTKIEEMLPYFTKQPTAADIQSMPGYQFAVDQGLGAVRQGVNVGSPGSNVDRAGAKFVTDYTLGTALPAYLAQRTGIYNTLANIAGIGQKSQESGAQLASSVAGNIGQLGIGSASALGAGQVGAANAYSGALGGVGNAATLYGLMNRQPTASPYSGGGSFGAPGASDYMGGAQGLQLKY